MRGLMIGRFQPFHLGHLELAKIILRECDELIICITSLQFNYMEKDPFTAGERIQMIHESLKEEHFDLSKCYVLAIENQFNIATWASYLRSSLPKFDRVYSGNDYVRMLLSDSGLEVIKPNFLNREKYNATSIRKLISENSDWKQLVPKAVADNIIKFNGIQRIQTILTSDTKPTEY
ncbi:MAG: nicotinamide-nucleotide adenylyltransferase [Crenarchaeota archaeon]|nr:MAG: nicotinamide-nucleotide adenylyltransferase [Thermoproteota archaeon]RDJ34265.1 MAG: nicotinamide-nucleotide adenylyltransferase [Thermoproteota archaeon]RDJ36622.1 MAG: nicotinamide-nucleotide adenylyltransferase [Thermoproteota archaeon]